MLKVIKALPNQLPGEVKRAIEKSGLDKIEGDLFSLVKVGAKHRSDQGHPDQFEVLRNGRAAIVVHDEFAWLYLETLRDWFKTSPVQRVEYRGDNYYIETENSFYELKPVGVKSSRRSH